MTCNDEQKKIYYGQQENFGATSMSDIFFKDWHKYVTILVIVALLGGVGFFIYKKKKGGFGRRR